MGFQSKPIMVGDKHGCGRDDCGPRRDANGELYWARLVCGHGDWPCYPCRYPIHPVEPCPGLLAPAKSKEGAL